MKAHINTNMEDISRLEYEKHIKFINDYNFLNNINTSDDSQRAQITDFDMLSLSIFIGILIAIILIIIYDLVKLI